MLRRRPAPLRPFLLGALVVLAGGGVGGWLWQRTDADHWAQLVGEARMLAGAFAADELERADAGPAAGSGAVRDRLQNFRGDGSSRPWLHLVRLGPDTSARVILTAAAPEFATVAVQPGPPLSEAVRTGRPARVGPWTDAAGRWRAAYAPIPASSFLLGLGADEGAWRRAQWRASLLGGAGACLVLGALAAGLLARRPGGQNATVRKLSEAMEQSRSAVMIVDAEGRIEYVNRGLCAQIGYAREELLRRSWTELAVAEMGRSVLTQLIATVRAGRPWEGEWTNRRQDGSVYPVRGGVTPVKRSDGSVDCFAVVFDDMTEAKTREAELRVARDLAEVGDRAKGRFLATMSHEVRTPLNGIVGFTSLLLETSLSSEQREYVQTIRMSTEALMQLTGDILDFARIESGKLKLDALATDPRECVEDALDLHAAKAADKGIELLHRFSADLPAAVVTDGGRLRQVLVNLIGNAVKFTERGEVEISVRRLPAATGQAEDCHLEFAVRDTGIGIPAESIPKLFRPFSQVDESTTRRYGGTGLGLAICRNLVELMGGSIDLTSQPGAGSTFRFSIHAPMAAAEPPARRLPGVRIALLTCSRSLRRELADLVQGWEGTVIDVDTLEQLPAAKADIAVVEIDRVKAREIVLRPELPAGLAGTKLFGLVPVSLSNELRTALRGHFRLLVSKPVHHDAFFALLAGSWGSVPTLQPPTHFGFRVLVVEDNRVNQRLVQRVLTNLGCSSTMVADGRKAIDLLADRPADFDLLVLDLHLPDVDGIDALREIRAGHAGPAAQTIWIIALTAETGEESRQRGLAEGLNDYLTKPVKLSDLEAALKRFRGHRAALKH